MWIRVWFFIKLTHLLRFELHYHKWLLKSHKEKSIWNWSFPHFFLRTFLKFLVKIVPCAKGSSNSYCCLSLTQIWVNWISQFYKKMCSRIWKGKYPVMHYGITCKSPKDAGRLILCLGALHNLVLYYTTEEETRLAVKWLPLIGYAVLGLAW